MIKIDYFRENNDYLAGQSCDLCHEPAQGYYRNKHVGRMPTCDACMPHGIVHTMRHEGIAETVRRSVLRVDAA